ncbi:MAG: glycosyltransferase family 4 protein [Prevotella sp.]|nr:glycosyltransferase family 4 protein [Prevotella sp.]
MTKTIIGFDAKRLVRNATGLGNYGRTLVNDMARACGDDWQLRLYAPDPGHDHLRQRIDPSPRIAFAYPDATTALQRSLWRIGQGLVRQLQRDGVQLFHGLSGELPRGISQTGIKSVVTIHDLIFMRHPEYYHWLDAKIYAWKFRYTCREADRIIAISERTKQDIIELGHVPAEKIDVIYQSCSPRFATGPMAEINSTDTEIIGAEKKFSAPEKNFSNAENKTNGAVSETNGAMSRVRAKYGLPRRFILSVGTIERRKNLLLPIRALASLPADIHLVAVGRQTAYTREFPADERIHLLSGVSDEELAALYQMAEVFVYPSRYEGFGIPIIEAIHSGLPVVACTGSCLEEAGGPDCLYVGPDDTAAMARAIAQLLKGSEGRDERIRRSQKYVRRFEGNDVAAQVLQTYSRLLG